MVGVVVALGFAACSGGYDAGEGDAAPRASGEDAGTAPASTVYDRRGELLAGETVLGVVVPRVMTRSAGEQTSERAALEAKVPMGKVLRFLQRRLTTGQVETGPNGARFVDATPRAPGDPTKRVTVWAYDDGRGTTRVTIYDRNPRPGPPLTDREISKLPHLRNDTKAPGTE